MDYKKMGKFLFAMIIKKYHLDDEKIINLSEYITKRNILDDETIIFLMDAINKAPLFKKELIIEYLCELYKSIYDENNSITKYLNKTSYQDLYSFFEENDAFKKELFNNFFTCIKNNTWDLDLIQKDEKENEVLFLPDMVRDAYEYICDKLYTVGADYTAVSKLIYNVLNRNHKVIFNDPKMTDNFNFLLSYKEVFIRIMFADVLLFLENEEKDADTKAIIDYIIQCAVNDKYYLPKNPLLASYLFEVFMISVEDAENRINIKNNSEEKVLSLYRDINPLYIIEDSKHLRGNK